MDSGQLGTPFPRSLCSHFRLAPAQGGLHFPEGMALEGRKWRPPRWTPGEGGRLRTRHALGAGTGRGAGLHFPAALLVQRLRCVTAAGGRWRRQRLWRGAAEGARGGRRPEPRENLTAVMASGSGDSVTRRSVASQFFTQEEGPGIDGMTTSERVVDLLNQAALITNDSKITVLRQVR